MKKATNLCAHAHGTGDIPHGTKDAAPRVLRRLSIIDGQIKGVRDMVARGEYCINVITQVSAIRNALSSIEDVLLENHLATCTLRQVKAGDIQQATKEILHVYKLKRK
jgi:DNA-binding FrmR family transcriptional regulator